jgi:hypothetical protein
MTDWTAKLKWVLRVANRLYGAAGMMSDRLANTELRRMLLKRKAVCTARKRDLLELTLKGDLQHKGGVVAVGAQQSKEFLLQCAALYATAVCVSWTAMNSTTKRELASAGVSAMEVEVLLMLERLRRAVTTDHLEQFVLFVSQTCTGSKDP